MTLDETIEKLKVVASNQKKIGLYDGARETMQIGLWLTALKFSRQRVVDLEASLAAATGRAYNAEEELGTVKSQARVAVAEIAAILDKYGF